MSESVLHSFRDFILLCEEETGEIPESITLSRKLIRLFKRNLIYYKPSKSFVSYFFHTDFGDTFFSMTVGDRHYKIKIELGD